MKYILEGNDNEVAKIVRENRIRVERGLVTFAPLEESPNPSDDEQTASNDDFFNDEEENTLSPEVQDIILEPIKGESEESAIVADKKDVAVSDKKNPKNKK